MQHLNPYRFYELALKLNALVAKGAVVRVADMFVPLTEAQALLDGWVKGSETYPLDMAKGDAGRLLSKISSVFSKYFIDQNTKQLKGPSGDERIDTHDITLVRTLLEKFESALAAEMNGAPVYLARKCGIYATADLISKASGCFQEDVRTLIPESALVEFDAAGRALAFELGSAAAMHLLRAVEIVLKKYFEFFAGAKVGKNERSYAIYLKKLASLAEEDAACKPDKRLLQMLAQIKEQYRNPLVAPESAISVSQAMSLFGLSTAAITLMVEQIAARSCLEGACEALEDVTAAAADENEENKEKKIAG